MYVLRATTQGYRQIPICTNKDVRRQSSTIALAKNPVNRQRCKHIDIKYHFIRATVNSGRVILEYCPTEQMIADVLTKPATKLKLKKFAQTTCRVFLFTWLEGNHVFVFYFQITQRAKSEWGC